MSTGFYQAMSGNWMSQLYNFSINSKNNTTSIVIVTALARQHTSFKKRLTILTIIIISNDLQN